MVDSTSVILMVVAAFSLKVMELVLIADVTGDMSGNCPTALDPFRIMLVVTQLSQIQTATFLTKQHLVVILHDLWVTSLTHLSLWVEAESLHLDHWLELLLISADRLVVTKHLWIEQHV